VRVVGSLSVSVVTEAFGEIDPWGGEAMTGEVRKFVEVSAEAPAGFASRAGDAGTTSGSGKSDSGCSVATDLGSTRNAAWLALALAAACLTRFRRRA
jgi:MYXO-CTERM domain-containing protein